MGHISIGNLSFPVMLDLAVDPVKYLFRRQDLIWLQINYLCRYFAVMIGDTVFVYIGMEHACSILGLFSVPWEEIYA